MSYLFGYGGHQPSLDTFGADQFDERNPKQQKSKAVFFYYFYFALNVGSLFSNTILVYFEDIVMWTLGFGFSTASAVDGPESAIKGSRKILHCDEFKCLDKAAVMAAEEQSSLIVDPWRLCTVTQVEEAKCVIRMLPIWLCTIIYSVVFTQMASLFVEQGEVTKLEFGNFHIPAASISAFDICSVLICTGIYRKILVPLAGRLSGNPKGLTELQRMGIALIIGMLAMIAAGITELERLRRAPPGKDSSTLSVLWQIPQYVLVGASEVFMYVGQLEFFNEQAPDGIKSFGSSLCMASISLGNYVSSMLVIMVLGITARGEKPGCIPEDLNNGHLDRFYFLINAGLTVIDFVIFVYCAKWYKSTSWEGSQNVSHKNEKVEDAVALV
ncbi:putative proton-dependent oligopeptide transporter family, major facilitator superfamily [Heracleum sosnowskyi]|uniref:Proton-dependent oligopeptide transporter family, major facilitator superfamily n=1 Tax=Heracleum sosnowskyi TaxID=360622 RepID=A0AAD8LW90_9APIA|nr:putative proton-dependent oligopeptide transporter family, major facilitator superfamily [Heracleum sosnowskyi]